MENKIGIIGFGNMGSVIAGRLKSKYKVTAFDKEKDKTADLEGIERADSVIDLVKQADAVVLAVKPQDFDDILSEIKVHAAGRLIISIAAGITTAYIERSLGEARVIRTMPNIGARLGEAETALCKGKNCSQEDMEFAAGLFNCIGKIWVLPEDMINASTAISGSGPAYIFYDMEQNQFDPHKIPEGTKRSYILRLTKAAEKLGFDSKTAMELAESTVITSIHLAQASGEPLSELRKKVTSKGGTTEAALKVISDGGSWEKAAEAAKKRAEELSRR